MLEQLTLTNFQIHKSFFIEFDPHVTVFVGDNGSGKSSILRMLRFITLNEWDGQANEMVSWGEDVCQGELVVDGHSITRTKGKDSNLYELDGELFKAFHPNVPETIKKLLRITVDNFQDQHDPAFWLTLNSSQAASALNEIFQLSQIDDSLDSIAKEVRHASTRLMVTNDRLSNVTANRKRLKWTVDANAKLRQLETIWAKLNETSSELRTIRELDEKKCQVGILDKIIRLGEECLESSKGIVAINKKITALRSIVTLEQEQVEIQSLLLRKQKQLSKTLKSECPLCGRSDNVS